MVGASEHPPDQDGQTDTEYHEPRSIAPAAERRVDEQGCDCTYCCDLSEVEERAQGALCGGWTWFCNDDGMVTFDYRDA